MNPLRLEGQSGWMFRSKMFCEHGYRGAEKNIVINLMPLRNCFYNYQE